VTALHARCLLPTERPRALINADGSLHHDPDSALSAEKLPPASVLLDLHRRMVVGRRFDIQATALTKQGRLAVYPSSRGQDACQVGATAAMAEDDWLFPTYRDSMAMVSRGINPVEVLTLLRGDWHCGYDPYLHRTAPQCTPLATNAPHAVGLAHAARLAGENTVALVLLGDGATSEGDTHEAMNIAAVWGAPVVFLIQNNGYAISVPVAKQTHAESLAHRGIGYGMPGILIDGNDAAMVFAAVSEALERARHGEGPTVIEALTYRIEAHTNADDATRYRDQAEIAGWLARDPIARLQKYLQNQGILDEYVMAEIEAESEARAARLRDAMNTQPPLDPADLFAHIYSTPTASLKLQTQLLTDELNADWS
jgi:pyruvate dehydrogenase E1 component alpha subunit